MTRDGVIALSPACEHIRHEISQYLKTRACLNARHKLYVLRFPTLLIVLCNGAGGNLFTAVNSFYAFYGRCFL